MTEQDQNASMRFTVRPPFAVHRKRVIERLDGARKIRELRTDSFWPNETVELTAEEASRHAHALVGIDDLSVTWLETRHHRPKVETVAIERAQLDELIAASVAQALASAGVAPKRPSK